MLLFSWKKKHRSHHPFNGIGHCFLIIGGSSLPGRTVGGRGEGCWPGGQLLAVAGASNYLVAGGRAFGQLQGLATIWLPGGGLLASCRG